MLRALLRRSDKNEAGRTADAPASLTAWMCQFILVHKLAPGGWVMVNLVTGASGQNMAQKIPSEQLEQISCLDSSRLCQ